MHNIASHDARMFSLFVFWTDKKNNMATTREQALYHLKRLAHAGSPHEFQVAEEDFFRSNTWIKLRRLQLWFRKIWQPQYQVLFQSQFMLLSLFTTVFWLEGSRSCLVKIFHIVSS